MSKQVNKRMTPEEYNNLKTVLSDYSLKAVHNLTGRAVVTLAQVRDSKDIDDYRKIGWDRYAASKKFQAHHHNAPAPKQVAVEELLPEPEVTIGEQLASIENKINALNAAVNALLKTQDTKYSIWRRK